MAYRRAGLQLTAPTVPLFVVAVLLAVLALLAYFGGIAIPVVSPHAFETLTLAFVVMTAGVLLRGI